MAEYNLEICKHSNDYCLIWNGFIVYRKACISRIAWGILWWYYCNKYCNIIKRNNSAQMHASDNDLNKLLINGRVRESRTWHRVWETTENPRNRCVIYKVENARNGCITTSTNIYTLYKSNNRYADVLNKLDRSTLILGKTPYYLIL